MEELRARNDEELQKELENSYRELMNLRFRWTTHQQMSRSEMTKVRRKIAQIHTILRERELGIRAA
ncbi:MAG: 50S ribosomal protein L29 [Chloroflexi bacterium]|nr:50S ribosomal protein L29 [Chloroflexota bacterium]